MELITILNRCHRFRGFVYQHAHFGADKKSIEVSVRPRKGSAAVCSRCHLPDSLTKGVPVIRQPRQTFTLRCPGLRNHPWEQCGGVAKDTPNGVDKRLRLEGFSKRL